MRERGDSELGCIIVLAIIGVVGYYLYTEHAAIKEAATQAAVVADRQAAIAALERAREEKSIELAKRARNLVQGRVFLAKPDPEVLTNEFQITNFVSNLHGEVTIVGWRTRKYSEDTFVVAFTYRESSLTRGWAFEVNVDANVVRSITGDAELERKYAGSW